ncbi:MAG: peroxiredoxin family protein [Anaerolineales bacterium]
MTDFQLASFVLLWIVIAIEGVLLLLLYRHTALVLSNRLANSKAGLPTGSIAPQFNARDVDGRQQALNTLLASDRTLLLFASANCEGCHGLLNSEELALFLSTNQINSYVLVKTAEANHPNFAALSGRREGALRTMGVENSVFKEYRVDATPFAYLLDQKGKVLVSSGMVDARQLVEACSVDARSTNEKARLVEITLAEPRSQRHGA